jgi:hypothetical protein
MPASSSWSIELTVEFKDELGSIELKVELRDVSWSPASSVDDVFEVVTEASIADSSSSVDICFVSVNRGTGGSSAGDGGGGHEGSSSAMDMVASSSTGSGDAASRRNLTSSLLAAAEDGVAAAGTSCSARFGSSAARSPGRCTDSEAAEVARRRFRALPPAPPFCLLEQQASIGSASRKVWESFEAGREAQPAAWSVRRVGPRVPPSTQGQSRNENNDKFIYISPFAPLSVQL